MTKSDLQSVRDELAGTAAPAGAPQTSELEAEIETLQAEVAALRAEVASKGKGSGAAEAPSAAPKDENGGTGGGEVPPAK